MLKTFLGRIFGAFEVIQELFRTHDNEFYEQVSAHGWTAVFKDESGDDDNSYIHIPLLYWEVTYCQGIPCSAIGVAFVNGKPSAISYAPNQLGFIGYQCTNARDRGNEGNDLFYESLNEWS